MPKEIWAVAAVTIIGAWAGGGLNLVARRCRESDSTGAVRLSVASMVVSVATLIADILLLMSARLYWFAWGLAAAFVLAYVIFGGVMLIALLRRRPGRAGPKEAGPSSQRRR